MNWIVILIAALVPMIMGFIWYNPKVFGTVWMKEAGVTEEKMQSANMGLIFGLSFVLSILLAMTYNFMHDHYQAFQAFFRTTAEHGLGVDPNSEFGVELKGLIDAYRDRFSSWTHGAVHSIVVSVFVVLPVMATNAMFERKSFKYVMVNWIYWALTIAIMYAVIAQFQ